MINTDLQKALKGLSPSFKEYWDAKSTIENAQRVITRFEDLLKLNPELLHKKFYVSMSMGFYSVGTFGGFDKNGSFILKIENSENPHYIISSLEDVFESKQENMKQLHTGIE